MTHVPQHLSVVLPLPPTTNTLYATVRGRRVLSKAGRDYHHNAGWLVKEAAAIIGWQTRPGRYRVEIVLHWPDRRRHDLDNACKALLDAATKALAFDDSAIDELHVYRGTVDKANPGCELRLTVLS